jgi:hypothetical protein
MGSRVRVGCGETSHYSIIAEPPADHRRSEEAVSVKFMPPAPDDKTTNSWMNDWTVRRRELSLVGLIRSATNHDLGAGRPMAHYRLGLVIPRMDKRLRHRKQ